MNTIQKILIIRKEVNKMGILKKAINDYKDKKRKKNQQKFAKKVEKKLTKELNPYYFGIIKKGYYYDENFGCWVVPSRSFDDKSSTSIKTTKKEAKKLTNNRIFAIPQKFLLTQFPVTVFVMSILYLLAIFKLEDYSMFNLHEVGNNLVNIYTFGGKIDFIEPCNYIWTIFMALQFFAITLFYLLFIYPTIVYGLFFSINLLAVDIIAFIALALIEMFYLHPSTNKVINFGDTSIIAMRKDLMKNITMNNYFFIKKLYIYKLSSYICTSKSKSSYN